jgi:hypothetical protein
MSAILTDSVQAIPVDVIGADGGGTPVGLLLTLTTSDLAYGGGGTPAGLLLTLTRPNGYVVTGKQIVPAAPSILYKNGPPWIPIIRLVGFMLSVYSAGRVYVKNAQSGKLITSFVASPCNGPSIMPPDLLYGLITDPGQGLLIDADSGVRVVGHVLARYENLQRWTNGIPGQSAVMGGPIGGLLLTLTRP